jgi:hypothetical protein
MDTVPPTTAPPAASPAGSAPDTARSEGSSAPSDVQAILNRPIKKKGLPSGREKPQHFFSGDGEDDDDERTEIAAQEEIARRDLNAFLLKKGMDPQRAAGFKIHLRLSKKDSRAPQSPDSKRWLVQYVSPDGSICTGKQDVHSIITSSDAKAKRAAAKTENVSFAPQSTANSFAAPDTSP